MDLPVISLESFLNNQNESDSLAECSKLVEALIKYGAILVKDPRVPLNLNSDFIDQIEKYYQQPEDKLAQDIKPEVGYRVGLTPPSQESPRCKADPHCFDVIDAIEEGSRPLTIEGPDPKWRYGWMITPEHPKANDLELLKAQAKIPEGFPNWENLMNGWGGAMVQTIFTLSKMLGKGFKVDENTFYNMIQEGSHLLSPTGSDLNKLNQVDTILAGFHYDLCFMTIHGKSRFPGLSIWAKDNKIKMPVKVPEGCLLVQAGKQLEWVTGGVIKAGYHQVTVTEATIQAVEKARSEERSLWRVSSTLFSHIESDHYLQPVQLPEHKATEGAETQYPKMLAHEYVQKELSGINLLG